MKVTTIVFSYKDNISSISFLILFRFKYCKYIHTYNTYSLSHKVIILQNNFCSF